MEIFLQFITWNLLTDEDVSRTSTQQSMSIFSSASLIQSVWSYRKSFNCKECGMSTTADDPDLWAARGSNKPPLVWLMYMWCVFSQGLLELISCVILVAQEFLLCSFYGINDTSEFYTSHWSDFEGEHGDGLMKWTGWTITMLEMTPCFVHEILWSCFLSDCSVSECSLCLLLCPSGDSIQWFNVLLAASTQYKATLLLRAAPMLSGAQFAWQ